MGVLGTQNRGSGSLLGAFRARLGLSWASLGCIFALMGSSRLHFAGFREPLDLDFGGFMEPLAWILEWLWLVKPWIGNIAWPIFFVGLFHLMGPLATQILCHLGDDAPCTSLRTAFNAAMTTRFHFPPLVLLPFRCGGLCAAPGIRRILLRIPRRVRQ